jgi:hypothetical protein
VTPLFAGSCNGCVFHRSEDVAEARPWPSTRPANLLHAGSPALERRRREMIQGFTAMTLAQYDGGATIDTPSARINDGRLLGERGEPPPAG